MIKSSALLVTAMLMGATALTSPVTASTLNHQQLSSSIYAGINQPLDALTDEVLEAESNQLIAGRRRCGRRCRRRLLRRRCRFSRFPRRCRRRFFRRRVRRGGFFGGKFDDDDGIGDFFDNFDINLDIEIDD